MYYAYRIDALDRITWVSDQWLRFARLNGAAELDRERVVGAPLFSFIAGKETRYLYRLLLEEVRENIVTLSVPLQCDGSTLRRLMRLYLSPAGDGNVELECRLLLEERRPPVALFDPDARRGDETLDICSWCKKIWAGGEWLETELAVGRLGLFYSTRLPRLRHQSCPACTQEIRGIAASGSR